MYVDIYVVRRQYVEVPAFCNDVALYRFPLAQVRATCFGETVIPDYKIRNSFHKNSPIIVCVPVRSLTELNFNNLYASDSAI